MPLAFGTPSHGAEGTGVTSYAAALGRAAAQAGFAPLAIDAGRPRGRWARRLRALHPGSRRVVRVGDVLLARDLFREAQVHFDLYGRPLTLAVAGSAPGIVHWTYPVPLRIAGWRNLYTVHDAIPLVAPDLTPIDARRHRRLLAVLAGEAAGFVTVSEAARGEIVGALGCDPAFVTALGMPLDVGDRSGRLPDGLVEGGYALHVGTIEPRKNIARLIDAYRASGIGLPLVLAGPDGWRAAEFAPRLAQPDIVRTGYLGRADLLRLIAGARFLAMPSLAEGFGLPVAEAMALGTPVLTSDRGALAEVAGGAALTVDPVDVAALAQAMTRLAHDDELCEELAARGKARGQAYDLATFAARLKDFYEKMGG